MKTKINIGHIVLCTLLFSFITGAVLYFFIKDASVVILPIVAVPFSALLIRLFMYNRAKYFNYILSVMGFAISIVAIDILLYYISEYGKDTMYFIMWKDLICFVCAMTMLDLAILIPIYLSNKAPRFMIIVQYACIALLIILMAAAGFVAMEDLKISSLAILVISAVVLAVSVALSLFKHRKPLTDNCSR